MSRSAMQLRQIIWRTVTDPTACMVSEIMRACRGVDGLMCCFDVWFAAQFLRDKCTAADFGLPRFHGRLRARGLLHARLQIRNLVYPLRLLCSAHSLLRRLRRTFYTACLLRAK